MANKFYTAEFKINAVALLREVQVGVSKVDGLVLGNVRDLCRYLEISTYTIYKWNKEIKHAKRIIDILDIELAVKGDIFGIRFYGWYAKASGMKNYSRMDLKQLKIEIAHKLIKEAHNVK